MFQSEIQKALSSYSPIGLSEMDEVSLMDRVETKYVFSSGKVPDLLNRLHENYKVLEIDSIRTFPYYTTYLDTPALLFYTQQLTGKLNRHKVRYRYYESTGMSFLEIKKRTNKNRTIKWRIESQMNMNSPDESASSFLKEHLPYNLPSLKPVLINGFNRITLVSIELKERVTMDYDVTFINPDGRISLLPFLAVAELKKERYSVQSPFNNIMKQLGLRSCRFSKYCVGSALITCTPRKNTIKPNLLLLNRIENEYTMSTRPRQN
jgi:hypothetical protein